MSPTNVSWRQLLFFVALVNIIFIVFYLTQMNRTIKSKSELIKKINDLELKLQFQVTELSKHRKENELLMLEKDTKIGQIGIEKENVYLELQKEFEEKTSELIQVYEQKINSLVPIKNEETSKCLYNGLESQFIDYEKKSKQEIMIFNREYWSKFATSKQDEFCSGDFGFGFIERLLDNRKECCSPNPTYKKKYESLKISSNETDHFSYPPTTFYCFDVHQQAQDLDYSCQITNAYINPNGLKGDKFIFSDNAVMGNCELAKNYNQRYVRNDVFSNFFNQVFKSTSNENSLLKNKFVIHDDEDVVTFITGRDIDYFHNIFHYMSDVVGAVYEMMAGGITPDRVRIVLEYDVGHCKFDDLWKPLAGKGLMGMKEFKKLVKEKEKKQKKDYITKMGNQVNPDEINSLESVFLMKHFVPSISQRGFFWKTFSHPYPCNNRADIFEAYKRLTLKYYNLLDSPLPADNENFEGTNGVRKIRVIFVSRKNHHRTILNEDKLIEAIKNLENVFTSENSERKIRLEIKAVDFKTTSIQEQVEAVRNADIMIGMHGAGFVNLMFMPEEAAIIEIFPRKWVPTSSRNFAKFLGKQYFSWANDDPSLGGQNESTKVVIPEVITIVKAAIESTLSYGKRKGHYKIIEGEKYNFDFY